MLLEVLILSPKIAQRREWKQRGEPRAGGAKREQENDRIADSGQETATSFGRSMGQRRVSWHAAGSLGSWSARGGS
jgi:hypothetical protein